MRPDALRFLCLALFAVFAAGCIDDPTAVEEEGAPPLSQDEIEFLGLTHLFTALDAQDHVEDSTDLALAQGRVAGSLASGAPALAPRTFDASVSTVVPCAQGGDVDVTASLTGVADEEAGTADLTFTFVLVPELCQEREGDFDVTLFGDPDITVVLELLTEGDGVIDILGSIRGGVGALTDGRVAECAMDLTFAGSETAETGLSLDVQGSVCGRSVTRSVAPDGS
jgi:hypothetical protein